MTRFIVWIAVSLDSFVAGIDTIDMGRRLLEQVQDFGVQSYGSTRYVVADLCKHEAKSSAPPVEQAVS